MCFSLLLGRRRDYLFYTVQIFRSYVMPVSPVSCASVTFYRLISKVCQYLGILSPLSTLQLPPRPPVKEFQLLEVCIMGGGNPGNVLVT